MMPRQGLQLRKPRLSPCVRGCFASRLTVQFSLERKTIPAVAKPAFERGLMLVRPGRTLPFIARLTRAYLNFEVKDGA
jgi:hypothetical protein